MGRAVERAWACKWGVWSREESGLAPSGSGVETGWDGGAFPRDGDHGKGPCFEEILSFPLDVQAQTGWHADIQTWDSG